MNLIMKQFVDIIRRREYLGFVLGCMIMIAAYELQAQLTIWFAIISSAIIFVGLPLVRKYGS